MNYEDPWISESIELENQRFQEKYPGLKRKVLLVGGGGYIGISIAKDIASNVIEVMILDNFIYGHNKAILTLLLFDNIQYFQHDIRKDLDVDFYSKNQKQKAKEFFNQILLLPNANSEIKLESQKRLNRDLGE